MIEEIIIDETREKMQKSIESLKNNFNTLRTGRVSPSLLDRIEIDYYGSMTPINQLASISVPEPRQLLIKPYDKETLKLIIGAINGSDLGINPINDGNTIRLVIPALTEDRRRDLAKTAKRYAEDAKVAIRNIRRDQNDELKKDKELPEDLRKSLEDEVQKITDEFVKKIDSEYAEKEKDIMTI